MSQPMPPQAQQAQQAQQQGGGSPADVLREMIISTDQAISNISQVIGKQIPEAGEALEQVGAQFRSIIEQVMSGGKSRQSDGQQVPADVGASRNARQVM